MSIVYTDDGCNTRRIKSRGRLRTDVKAEELFVTRGARGKTRPWNCGGERGARIYIRGRNCSFMQGAIVNQSASTADHKVDAGPRDRKSESDPGEERAQRR